MRTSCALALALLLVLGHEHRARRRRHGDAAQRARRLQPLQLPNICRDIALQIVLLEVDPHDMPPPDCQAVARGWIAED